MVHRVILLALCFTFFSLSLNLLEVFLCPLQVFVFPLLFSGCLPQLGFQLYFPSTISAVVVSLVIFVISSLFTLLLKQKISPFLLFTNESLTAAFDEFLLPFPLHFSVPFGFPYILISLLFCLLNQFF